MSSVAGACLPHCTLANANLVMSWQIFSGPFWNDCGEQSQGCRVVWRSGNERDSV